MEWYSLSASQDTIPVFDATVIDTACLYLTSWDDYTPLTFGWGWINHEKPVVVSLAKLCSFPAIEIHGAMNIRRILGNFYQRMEGWKPVRLEELRTTFIPDAILWWKSLLAVCLKPLSTSREIGFFVTKSLLRSSRERKWRGAESRLSLCLDIYIISLMTKEIFEIYSLIITPTKVSSFVSWG